MSVVSVEEWRVVGGRRNWDDGRWKDDVPPMRRHTSDVIKTDLDAIVE